jgi:hypothetical protein
MITELDIKHYTYWMPLHLLYEEGTITITLEELFTNTESENIKIGDKTIENVYKMESTQNSKKYDIIFNNVHFFQVYDELKHIENADEQFDKGIIRKYTKSTLMDFIENNTLFKTVYEDLFNNLKHYCVRTSTDWFNILGLSEPIIKLINPK